VRTAPDQGEQQFDGGLYRAQCAHPLFEFGLAELRGLLQPVVVKGQVESTGSAGYAAALHNAFQEFVLLERLTDLAVYLMQLPIDPLKLIKYLIQALDIHSLHLFDCEQLEAMALKLFQEICLDIGPGEDADDIEQGIDCGATAPGIGMGAVVIGLPEQMLQTQVGPDFLIERVFIDDFV